MDKLTALYTAIFAMFVMPLIKVVAIYVGERNRCAEKWVWIIGFALALGWLAYLLTLPFR